MKIKTGGESGIRTRDRLFTYTRFPGVLLQPLGHLTIGLDKFLFVAKLSASGRCLFYT